MRFSRLLIAAAVTTAAGVFSPVAHANSLIGDQISAAFYYPTFGSPCCSDVTYSSTSFQVASGPTPETTLQFGAAPITFNFDASSLTITFLNSTTPNSATFNGPVFTNLSGANFGTLSTITGGNLGVVGVTNGNELSINWQGVTFTQGETIVLSFDNAAAVPGPIVGAGMPGLVMALGGFVAWRRRRNQAAAA
jgi:hypothetical protein